MALVLRLRVGVNGFFFCSVKIAGRCQWLFLLLQRLGQESLWQGARFWWFKSYQRKHLEILNPVRSFLLGALFAFGMLFGVGFFLGALFAFAILFGAAFAFAFPFDALFLDVLFAFAFAFPFAFAKGFAGATGATGAAPGATGAAPGATGATSASEEPELHHFSSSSSA